MHAISLVQVALLALASSSWAITVTKPAQGDTWSSGGPNVVSWALVSTDPTNFSLALVEGGVLKQMLASSIDGTQGSLTVTASNLPTGSDFQVNIVNPNTNAILAQSAQFNITQGGGSSTASTTGTGSSTISSSTAAGSASASVSAVTSAASDTNIPNSSGTALNPTATKSSAASLSIPGHSALVGLLALFGLALA